MANAFLLRPLPMAALHVGGTIQAGAPAYLGNDYAGIVCRFACDLGGNVGAIEVDFGADVQFDTVMLFGLTMAPPGTIATALYATAGAPNSFSVVASGAAYAGSEARRPGEGAMLLMFAGVTGRYLNINFAAGASGQSVQATRLVAGRRFQPAIGFEFGAQFGVRDLGSFDLSSRGVPLRHRGRKLRTVSLSFPALNKQEAESVAQKLLEEVGNTECIALCTDPAPDPERQSRCYYGPMVGDLGRTWATAAGHKVPINLVEIL